MTLGPKFFFSNKMAVTQRRSNLFPKFWKIPAALDEYFAMAVSNRDLKPSGTFVQKIACDLGFAAYQTFGQKAPCGSTVCLKYPKNVIFGTCIGFGT